MNTTKIATKRTICEVLREIYDRIDQNDLEITNRLDEATHMAKRMGFRLKEYKDNWQDEFFTPNTDIKEKARIRG